MSASKLPEWYDPQAGDPHQRRFAKALALTDPCSTAIEALKIAALLEWLRATEADQVNLLCANPDPETLENQQCVVCNGYWTNYEDEYFYGGDLVVALEKAAMARLGREKR